MVGANAIAYCVSIIAGVYIYTCNSLIVYVHFPNCVIIAIFLNGVIVGVLK